MFISMKIFMTYAVNPITMPSPGLKIATMCAVLLVVLVSFYGGPGPLSYSLYQGTIRVLSGVGLIAGSLSLGTAISRTFLRSGGLPAFKGAYVAVLSISGLGVSIVLSVFYPVSMSSALLAYALISMSSGLLWVRFYAI